MRVWKICVLFFCFCAGAMIQAQTAEDAKEFHEKGHQCLSEGMLLEGREYARQAMEIRKDLYGELNVDYITSFNNYAFSYFMADDYGEALRLQREILELCGRLEGAHPLLGMFLANAGRSCYMIDDYASAAEYWEKALLFEDKYTESYEFLLSSLAMVYDELGDMEGTTRIMALMKDHNNHELTKECNEPGCMLERAQYYVVSGENAKAKECFLSVLSMRLDADMRVKVYDEYAMFLFSLNDFISAAEYKAAAADVLKETEGLTEEYAQTAYSTASFYFIGGQFDRSLVWYRSAKGFYEGFDTPTSRANIAKCLMGMGNAYSAMANYPRAKECFFEEISYYENENREDDEYPKAIFRLAKAEKHNKDYAMAIEHHRRVMTMFEERGMMQEYSEAASSLQMCYFYAGISDTVAYDEVVVENARKAKLEQLIADEKANLGLVREYLGSLAYANSLATIASCYDLYGAYDSSVVYYKEYMRTLRGALGDEFRLQNEEERMVVWREQLESIQQICDLLVRKLLEGDTAFLPDLASLVYDAELLSKGILLKSAIEFGKVLEEQGNVELQQAYARLRENAKEIERLRFSATTNAELRNIVDLAQQNQALTLYLYGQCAEFADFTDYLMYDWKDVRAKLSNKDVAIEFAAIESGLGILDNQNLMVALVLSAGKPFPVAIPICTLAEVAGLVGNDMAFQDTQNLVWGALDSYLEGKERIFFSADGDFNQVGIEYLLYHGRPLSHQFEVYRLSSTKELCYGSDEKEWEMAVLFGDINYNDNGACTAESSSIETLVPGFGGFANLSGSLEEVETIANILEEGHVDTISLYSDILANKDAFLKLSGSGLNLLHIATHGLCIGKDEDSDESSMANSMLALAGANLVAEGVISAAEIAPMNLRQCSLVVLSACETGLGKLGEDGVFGLQRGFKNAGAHTLLMSLRSVYDEATAQLMIAFYRYLMEGVSAHEALFRAQQDLMQNGYADPKYWATFILLDAI